jgi:hypothetical protein
MITQGAMRWTLRAEGLVYFLFALAAYHVLHGSWMMFLILFLLPDLSFAAYLAGPRIGAVVYNVMHSTIGPIVLVALGYVTRHPEFSWIALIWFAHVGFDRMLGYGFKYASGFKDTHLGKL